MNIKVYTKTYCPYCQKVLRYLKKKNINFEEVEVSNQPDVYANLKKETGHQTVPQVFVNNKFIGGADDFFANKDQLGL